ncbi:dentin sialophosphoprotein-like isoform X2 [Pseudoliparis swirei]|uniref:dentin sialophosphoprotein-like isoform X2 n=1 Tax=Pseudoliparis swirei TaxID=2059687 RepID=UPI0024BEC426|nr:dentin sialophosphoprotein-like isoform X2 [Pseudoliparis swirei]
MAARKENSLSLEHLTGPKRNTFTKQKEHRLKISRGMQLQQCWQELKQRQFTAQQNNKQLLQQFEEAQDTLAEMLTLTATMKTIRMEYERYLESCPRWQQQLKEKTQAAQIKRTESLRSCLKNTEERETATSADQPLPSQGSTTMNHNIAAHPKHYSPNSHLHYNQDSPHLSSVQSSWQTRLQSQTASFPIRALHQPQCSSHVPPYISTHPHALQLHLNSSPSNQHPRPPQPDYPWSWAAGAAGIPSCSEALWGQLYTEQLPPHVRAAQVVGEEADTSSKRERGGGSRSSRLSQELDVKPVRLSGGFTESSESTREPGQVSTENRKKREGGRSLSSSSDSQGCISQDSSRSSSVIVIAAVKVVQRSESDASSKKSRTSTRRRMRSGGLAVGSPREEKGSKGDEQGSHNEESQSTSEELGSQIEESRSENAEDRNLDDTSEHCGEESGSQKEEETGSDSIKIENGGGDEIEKQASSSSQESNVGEKDEEDLDGEDEYSQMDEDQEERDGEEDREAAERKNATEDDEETGAEDEEQNSEDEEMDESDRGEDNMEDRESDEEEQREDLAEPEESDSDDSIISPQDKSKKMHIIPEASEEDEKEEESKTGSSDDDSNEISDEDDVENLLAPQELSEKKEEKDLRADEQPKAMCDNVEIFQVELDKSTKSDHPSDSEFDDFYA